MADLIAKSALAGHAPLTLAGVTLSEIALDPITSIAPFSGQDAAVAKALGLVLPAPNRFAEAKGARLVWTGRGQYFLIGSPTPKGLAGIAALTDQSDGWAALRLDGPGTEAALARIVPVDIRLAAFPEGAALRTAFNHMNAVLMRTGAQTVDILVFRSMARTAWHEVEAAMTALAARQRLT
ncbi:sarcosine oxidase subunit gamma [Tabrizicola sp. J26]|uniref:sarcosine oxidase subunit gamma n=1 Tax=Alitabrizicola rongguiensis TaxID=2909234 RepID=UPI001F3D1EA3|nr:sarcosine oxidase subunit gamma family protein [Tabrizicola rongguiensis]MCF1708397.1 sarcosine oxidase subunit gamma [Tabrizicola rongguiensis]